MAHAAFTIFGIKYKIARLQIVRCNFNAESVIGSKVCGCIFVDGKGVIYNVGSRIDTCRVQTLVDQTGAVYIGSRCSGTANFVSAAVWSIALMRYSRVAPLNTLIGVR